MQKRLQTLTLLIIILMAASCSDCDSGDSDGDMEQISDADIDIDAEALAEIENDNESDRNFVDGEFELDIENISETEVENDGVESVDKELEPDEDLYGVCSGSCDPNADMQYCLDEEHLCYCDATDNTLKYFPPTGKVVVDGEPCQCVEKDGVSYCDFMIIGLCEMSFCNAAEGQVVACYDTSKYIDYSYSSGLCLDWDLYPPEESADCDVLGEACGSEEGYICMQWPGQPAKCVKTCESVPDTCVTDYFIGCQPFRDRNRKLYPLGVCRQDWI